MHVIPISAYIILVVYIDYVSIANLGGGEIAQTLTLTLTPNPYPCLEPGYTIACTGAAVHGLR